MTPADETTADSAYDRLPAALRPLLGAELAAGNRIAETDEIDDPPEIGRRPYEFIVILAEPFHDLYYATTRMEGVRARRMVGYADVPPSDWYIASGGALGAPGLSDESRRRLREAAVTGGREIPADRRMVYEVVPGDPTRTYAEASARETRRETFITNLCTAGTFALFLAAAVWMVMAAATPVVRAVGGILGLLFAAALGLMVVVMIRQRWGVPRNRDKRV